VIGQASRTTRNTPAVPTPLPITGRPVRLAVVGLGTISELMLPSYRGRDDVEIVGLCDRDPAKAKRWASDFPDAKHYADLDEMLGIDADVIDVLVPTPLHAEVVTQVLEAGYHVQVQKPIARDLADATRMVELANERGAMLRILEDYLFYPPVATLREIVASGEIGEPAGLHMKIVATGRGGWDIADESFRWIFEQARDGRGLMVFDHGWHQLAVAMAMFGDVRRIWAWIGATEIIPEIVMDAPTTLVWEHTNGVRGVLDITFAPDTLFRSEYYTCDERIEVTGRRGYARCNRISACGVQEPSVVVYQEGEMRGYHALDDRPPAGFLASTDHVLAHLRGETDELVMDGESSRRVLCALLAAYDASERGQAVDVVYD
jgi:predicted dehydrogenase